MYKIWGKKLWKKEVTNQFKMFDESQKYLSIFIAIINEHSVFVINAFIAIIWEGMPLEISNLCVYISLIVYCWFMMMRTMKCECNWKYLYKDSGVMSQQTLYPLSKYDHV